jgi:hypothetical protein
VKNSQSQLSRPTSALVLSHGNSVESFLGANGEKYTWTKVVIGGRKEEVSIIHSSDLHVISINDPD